MNLYNKNALFFNKSMVVSIILSLAIYILGCYNFTNRFYFKTIIHNIDVSNKTIEEAKELISKELHNYKIELIGRDCINEVISANDINLEYNIEAEINKIKNSQNPFGWIKSFFTYNIYQLGEFISYNEEKLIEKFNTLHFFDESYVVLPKNPTFQFDGNEYIIKDEIKGNLVNKEKLYSNIKTYIYYGKKELDIEESNCYEDPKYFSNSKEAREVKEQLDTYIRSSITYVSDIEDIVLDSEIIKTWISVNDDFKVVIDERKIDEFVSSLSKIYNTVGKKREFKSSYGQIISVIGGDYGTAIDEVKEREEIIDVIKKGTKTTREPIYSQRSLVEGENDIGNTYVEINMTKQYIWFYKDGQLIVDGNVVTGNISKGHKTPEGIYTLKFKQKDVILRGDNYQSPVKYWMPFNGGIGIHDASWRYEFGGSIYKTRGSHGCVNTPVYIAKTIFDHIDPGTPIICYNE